MAIPEGLLSYVWVALCAVVAPAVFGLGIVRALGLPAAAGTRTSWAFAYLAGQFLLAPLTALWLLLGQPVPGIVLPLAAAATGSWLIWRRCAVAPASSPRRRGGWWWLSTAVTALLVAVWLYDCLRANCVPIRIGDESEIWAAKAKALYAAPSIDLALGLSMVSHADYPSLNPLMQVLAFAASGRVLHFENRLPLQGFGIALLLLLSAATTRRAHPLVAVCAMIVCSATLATAGGATAYSDVPLAAATLAAVDALLRWRETGERVWWRLACLCAGAMLALKNEGAMLLLAIAVPASVFWLLARTTATPRPALARREVVWLLAPAVTLTLHWLLRRAYSLHTDLFDPALAGGRGLFTRLFDQLATHAPQVARFFGSMAVDQGAHRLLPLMFAAAGAVALIASRGRWCREPAAILLGIVITAIAGYMLVFIGTHADLTWHLATAAARTVEHVVPVAALGCAMTIAPRAAEQSIEPALG